VNERIEAIATRLAALGPRRAPRSEEALASFEARHRVALPAEYRAFLLAFGDVTLVTEQGIAPLARAASPERLSRDFPFRETWLYSPDAPEPEDPLLGCLELADEGCGIRSLLVVSGPEHGHVWIDSRADDYGIYPLPGPSGGRASFLDWLEKWTSQQEKLFATMRAPLDPEADIPF